jgi:ketosteroid isomerase-like protein
VARPPGRQNATARRLRAPVVPPGDNGPRARPKGGRLLDSGCVTGHPGRMHRCPLTLLAALAAALPLAALGEPRSRKPAGPPADERALREADQAFDRALAARDRAAFGELIAEDACFAGGGALLRGRAAVLSDWAPFFEPEGPRLTWAPELAELAKTGDLGYTVGHYRFEARDAQGAAVTREGRYVTVWRRGPDGAYRAAADAPLLPPGDDAPELLRTAERTLSSTSGDLVVEVGRWEAKEPAAGRGLYLSIRRKTREGTLAAALETLLKAPAAATGN